jgi:ElaA protein
MTSTQVIHRPWGEFTPDEVFEMAVLRSEVFFLEQKIDEEEFDAADRDPSTIHLWIADEQGMAAYLRIVHTPDAASDHEGIVDGLGRMVVRASARGKGLAQLLMSEAVNLVGDRPLYLHAQDYVTSLYEKYGFERRGELFQEAGIPHVLMVRHNDA